MELVSFGMGADWIVKLYKKLKSIRKKNIKALNEINTWLPTRNKDKYLGKIARKSITP